MNEPHLLLLRRYLHGKMHKFWILVRLFLEKLAILRLFFLRNV
jgi:hypothetical protein